MNLFPEAVEHERQVIDQALRPDVIGRQLLVFLGEIVEYLVVFRGGDKLPLGPRSVGQERLPLADRDAGNSGVRPPDS